MSKGVEDVNFTRKSKKQNNTDERAKEIGKGGYFGRKKVRIQYRKHVLGVAVVILIRHNVQRQGKRVITSTEKITSKEFADVSLGRIRVMGNR